MDHVNELERAILSQADRLAREYRERAEHSRDNILREANERLRLREDREVLLAKARAERAYRRKVQANELRLQKAMDHLRWNLVDGIRELLTDRIQALTADEGAYLPLLQRLLARGAALIERDPLVAEVNATDLKRLRPAWESFCDTAEIERAVTLSDTARHTLGGVLVRSADNRIRVDNTFEGRMERLAGPLHQVIIERLLPGGEHVNGL